MKKIRCAIYTRKSSEEGLDQDFNSLDAQREACEAYIISQKHEGWVVLLDHYDDGGVSGGTLDRSGLQRLLQAIDDGLVDQIVVYKIDRLTRSLMDFSRLIERLDAADASFVSVTQSFNTATSMGRLTLNVLLSFAQFEREVTAERIRDKIAASKKKGMWVGGPVPLGYRTQNRKLIIQDDEAASVRTIYKLYQEHPTVRELKQAADCQGLLSRCWTTKSGKPMGGKPYSRGHLYRILTNPIYIGQVSHKGKIFDGQHEAIIEFDQWQMVQDLLKSDAVRRRIGIKSTSPKSHSNSSALTGKLFDETGDRLTPSHANKSGRRYRYYVSNRLIRKAGEVQPTGGWRLPAPQLEEAVCNAIQNWLTRPSEIQNEIYPNDRNVDQLQQIIAATNDLNAKLKGEANPIQLISTAIDKITIGNGKLKIALNSDAFVKLLNIPANETGAIRRNETVLIAADFRHRKRGVESKLMLGTGASKTRDHILIANIARAKEWLNHLQAGGTTPNIAINEGRSVRQIQRHLELAFLSPTIVKMIAEGTQPPELTSRQLINTAIPMDWDQQHQKFGIK